MGGSTQLQDKELFVNLLKKAVSIIFLLHIMKTATLVIFILGTCFYMSIAAPGQAYANNQVAMAADLVESTDSCLLCELLMDHICEDNNYIITRVAVKLCITRYNPSKIASLKTILHV